MFPGVKGSKGEMGPRGHQGLLGFPGFKGDRGESFFDTIIKSCLIYICSSFVNRCCVAKFWECMD